MKKRRIKERRIKERDEGEELVMKKRKELKMIAGGKGVLC